MIRIADLCPRCPVRLVTRASRVWRWRPRRRGLSSARIRSGLERSFQRDGTIFFRTSLRAFRRKNKRKNRDDIKEGCCRFRCWSRRESAWTRSKVILAMGGTPGPAPRSMQLSQPSLLSYLERFNQKRRIHYKIDVQPRWRSDAPSPRIQAAARVQRSTDKAASAPSLVR